MRPANSRSQWFAAAVCVLATTGITSAEEAVLRVSDSDKEPAVVRMNAGEVQPQVRQSSLAPPNARNYYQSMAYSPQQHFAAYASYYGLNQPSDIQLTSGQSPAGYSFQTANSQMAYGGHAGTYSQHNGFAPASYAPQACGTGDCNSGLYTGDMNMMTGGWDGGSCGCGTEGCSSCDKRGRRNRNSCDAYSECEVGDCDSCYTDGYNQRLRLLAGALPKGNCGGASFPCRWWRGQQANYLSRNQRLANHLFGRMIPSGCNGQGCPPVGCYGITYADDPAYAHPSDGQQYGAQGYGVPMTVPLAPNVRYSYNYSWGTPSSRLTPVGSYDPQTSPQPLYRPTF